MPDTPEHQPIVDAMTDAPQTASEQPADAGDIAADENGIATVPLPEQPPMSDDASGQDVDATTTEDLTVQGGE